jgi:hypothetical protein
MRVWRALTLVSDDKKPPSTILSLRLCHPRVLHASLPWVVCGVFALAVT